MLKSLLAIAMAATVVVLVAIPDGRADDKQPPPSRREIVTSQNNLKQIALAFHNHNDAFGKLPNNISTKDGKPLLSWRVQILPFVEQSPLYMQFKMDEAWDSPANKKLIAAMPKLYAPVRVKAKEGETYYCVFTGDKAPFGPKNAPAIPRTFLDGTSNTGMVFEAGDPVIWTKPDDMAFDEKLPVPKLGGLFGGDFNVALADGSVMLCKKDGDEKELRKLIMPADGEVLDIKKLKK